MASTMNITITVPQGTTNHGNPNLLCTPSKWRDILTFYVVNYLAHAITVKSMPGEQPLDTIFAIFSALIYPYSGIIRGVEAIFRRAAWVKGNQIQRAARAGALCVVIRTSDWKPLPRSRIKGVRILPGNGGVTGGEPGPIENGHPITDALWKVQLPKEMQEGIGDPVIYGDRTVHGVQRMPKGYSLAILPSNALIEPGHTDIAISFSYSLLQAVISFVQVCYASVTLYESRGDQLSIYGYAAFGLTVIPYIIMSVVNLFGNILTPAYPTLYLVRSSVMKEAEDLKAEFDGVVGTLVEDLDPVPHDCEGFFEQHGSGYLLTNVSALDNLPSISEPSNEKTPEITNVIRNTNENADNPEPLQTSKQETVTNIKASQESYTLGLDQDEIPNSKKAWNMKIGLYVPAKYDETTDASRTNVFIPAVSRFKTQGSEAWGKRRIMMALFFIVYVMAPIPYLVIEGLTNFKVKNSTKSQRVWTMGWLTFGTFVGASIPIFMTGFRLDGRKSKLANARWWIALSLRVYILAIYSFFAFGGFVVVGQMFMEYGSCNYLT